MIKSMTAYGRATGSAEGRDYTVELKSVNNRFFDCTVKLPRTYGYLEERVRNYVQKMGVSRGKVDIYVGIDTVASEDTCVSLNVPYAGSYIAALRELGERFGLKDDLSVMTVAGNSALFMVKTPEADTDREWNLLLPTLTEATEAYIAAREREGANLRTDILAKKEKIGAMAISVKKRSEENIAGYAERLEQRLSRVLEERDLVFDSARILTECAIYADKLAIDEENVRLDSHLHALEEALESDEPVGRKIDFLLQEINREVNTIGSKSQDTEIARTVIDIKCELEKIREQIQNIE